jgi:hypothetical protein
MLRKGKACLSACRKKSCIEAPTARTVKAWGIAPGNDILIKLESAEGAKSV